jgi:hypothetical protein
VCKTLRALEDPFELIPGHADAERVFAEVMTHDHSYELLALSYEERLVDDLFARDAERFLAKPTPEEVAAFERTRNRLAARPSPPTGKVLGYDVGWFDHGFWSPVVEQIIGATIEPFSQYSDKLNQFGLFTDPDIAAAFLQEYIQLPEPLRETGDFYALEVRRPILRGTPLAPSITPN